METHMVRLAEVKDAEQLKILNTEFNGPNDRAVPQIKESLISNCQEIVIVDDTDGRLTGTDNHSAQSVYNKLGYHRDGEIHMSKS